ncbi:MAG TPA: peptidoglycan-binding domain-containing protein [Chthoniobacterales bacterium]|nr:peptidoglycan-binding domain-containing protein [Chthoniobacterales bacterium]
MNSTKLILLSYVAPTVLAISTAMAAQGTMQTSAMHPAHRSSAARAPMMTNSASGFHRFNSGDRDRDDRFRRFHRFNNFVFFDFGSPFFYPYPYYDYYPYGYYAPPVYQGYSGGVSVIVQVQRRLASAGYYRGAIDGVIGSGTRRAIRSYERSHGLPADGALSERFLATMRLG